MLDAALAILATLSIAISSAAAETPAERALGLCSEATEARGQGDHDRALAKCREAVALDEHCSRAWFLLGDLYEMRGSPIEAFDAYDREILATSSLAGAIESRRRMNRCAQARVENLTGRIANPAPSDKPRAVLVAERARCRLVVEEFDGAAADVAEALRLAPEDPAALYVSALVRLDAADVRPDPGASEEEYIPALVALQLDGWDAAKGPLARARELCPPKDSLSGVIASYCSDHEKDGWISQHTKLAIVRSFLHEPSEAVRQRLESRWNEHVAEEAREAAARAAELAEQQRAAANEGVERPLAEARAAYARQDLPAVVARCTEALAILPGHAPAALLMGKALHAQGDDDQATEVLSLIRAQERDAETAALRIECTKAAFAKLLAAARFAGAQPVSRPEPEGEDDLLGMFDLRAEAEEYAEDMDHDRALLCLDQAARLAPRSLDPYSWKLLTLERTERYEETCVLCDEWIRRLEASQADTSDVWNGVARLIAQRYRRLKQIDEDLRAEPGSAQAWIAKAQVDSHKRDLTSAMDAADRVIALEPENAVGYALRADILDRGGAPAAIVLAECERSRKLDGGRDLLACDVARRVHMRHGDTAWVLGELDRRIALGVEGRDAYDLHVARARLAMERGEHAKAITDFDAAIGAGCRFDCHARRERREAWSRVGNHQAILADTTDLSPNDRITMRQRLRALLQVGDDKGALEVAARLDASESSIVKNPARGRAQRRYEMGVAAEKRGNAVAALAAYREALTVSPGCDRARLRRAVLIETSDLETKKSEFAFDLEVKQRPALELMRRVQEQGNLPSDAELQAYARLMDESKFVPTPTLSLSDAIRTVVNREIASAWSSDLPDLLSEYLEESPESLELTELRARAYDNPYSKVWTKLAIVDVARCIELRPGVVAHQLWLARLHARLLEVGAALGAFDRAIALAPTDPQILVERGQMFDSLASRVGDPTLKDRALADAASANEIRPTGEAYRLMAYLYEERGRLDDALRCADQITVLAPASPIPDLPKAYAKRKKDQEEAAALREVVRTILLEDAETRRLEAERARALQSAASGSTAPDAPTADAFDRFRSEFDRLMSDEAAGRTHTWSRMNNDSWNHGGFLQQRLDAESRFNSRCHELERRFGSSAADLERRLGPH